MQNEQMAWQTDTFAVAQADVETRANFISRTYSHVFGAIVAFTVIEMALYQTGLMEGIARKLMGSGAGWLLVLGAFMLVGWMATRTALNSVSRTAQYAALFGFVLAEAIIFCPLLYIAAEYAPGAISSAALITLLGFAALTGIAFYTKKDFSFLGGILKWGFVVAMLLIVGGIAFGFNLGLYFSVAMVAFAGAAVLYDTSNILHHYPQDRHVAAALALFASVALMFWYVLQIAISLQSD